MTDLAIIHATFPSSLADDVTVVSSHVASELYPATKETIDVHVAGKLLRIPGRVYSDIPQNMSGLTAVQTQMLAAWFTRHHNGHVREQFVRQLLPLQSDWCLPFIVQIVGEYIPTIIDVVCDYASSIPRDLCLQFAQNNEQYLSVTRQRVISYWNVYYRSCYPTFALYPGYQAMLAMGLWRKPDGYRLLRATPTAS